ncbi:MAG: sigma-70 family RNA polymerase sigma factor [bacterium]|nr:sigma-70 family RNA polymerase sigma factor [bacterium]
MDLEHDFAEWVDRRDPAALTRVFDATAGRLVLVASHLVGREGSAEDLVQATFLAAMAKATTWDRSRPLWPWLTGILQNEARMHWRRQQRRREVDLAAATAEPAATSDPQAIAASGEAFDALVAAIEELPLPYRQVLRLRLVHGMEPIAIAQVLEQPTGTVRAQLHRGLERLRQALPAGVASAVAAWLTSENALFAQVRERVIAEAMALANATPVGEAPTGVAPTDGSLLGVTTGHVLHGGWWAMHGKTVGVAVVGAALLLLGAYVGWLKAMAGEDSPTATPDAASAGVEVAAESGAASEVVADAGDEVERDVVEPGARALWQLEVVVRSGGEPVAEANVRVSVVPRGFGYGESAPASARIAIAHGTTDADGRFRCVLDELRERSTLFRCTNYVVVEAVGAAAGRADRDLLSLPRALEPHEFLAEMELESGAGITGRVVDGDGLPVAGASIHRRYGERLFNQDATSRADGTFFVPVPDEDGPEAIVARDPRHGVVSAAIERKSGEAFGVRDVGTITFAGESAIRGRVLLADGAPLANYPVFVATIDPALADPLDVVAIQRSFMGKREVFALRDGSPAQVRTTTMTDEGGGFVCAGLDPAAVYAVCVRSTLHSCVTMVAARVGETVKLNVDRQLLLLSVCGPDGEELPGAEVRGDCFDLTRDGPVWKPRPGFPEKGQIGSAGFFSRDASGRLQVLSPFGHVWALYTTDEIAQAAVLRHDVHPGIYRVERSLVVRPAEQFGALRLLVESPTGEPIEEHGFELRHLERDLSRTHTLMIPPEDRTYRELPVGRWHLSVLLSRPMSQVFGYQTAGRGRHEREIVIQPGAITEVRVVAHPAGRIAFRMRSSKVPDGGTWGPIKVRGGPDNKPLELTLHADDQAVSPWPIESTYYLAKSAFPPGKWGFEVLVNGYEPAFCEVEVEDARLSTAIVELTPR